MLILTRRMGERPLIGDEITISVLGRKGQQVRVGIDAPRDVAVHREEIYKLIESKAKAKSSKNIENESNCG